MAVTRRELLAGLLAWAACSCWPPNCLPLPRTKVVPNTGRATLPRCCCRQTARCWPSCTPIAAVLAAMSLRCWSLRAHAPVSSGRSQEAAGESCDDERGPANLVLRGGTLLCARFCLLVSSHYVCTRAQVNCARAGRPLRAWLCPTVASLAYSCRALQLVCYQDASMLHCREEGRSCGSAGRWARKCAGRSTGGCGRGHPTGTVAWFWPLSSS